MTHEGSRDGHAMRLTGIKASICSPVGMPESSSLQEQIRLLSRNSACINLEPHS
jgi:hypothetical protein